MRARWRWLWLTLLTLLCALPQPAAAQEAAKDARSLAAVKEWFSAAQAAYEAGDYLAAIQALEAANELAPSAALVLDRKSVV